MPHNQEKTWKFFSFGLSGLNSEGEIQWDIT